MIYTFNARDFLLYPAARDFYKLSDEDVYNMISADFNILKQRLDTKDIPYDSLKRALVPNQDKKKYETCFVFDTNQMEQDDYARAVFEKVLPVMDKKSTYSILYGDYVDILRDVEDSQIILRDSMNEVLTRCHSSKYQYSGQYFLIYVNSMTGNQRWEIVKCLLPYPWFLGFADVTYGSKFKSYISCILSCAYVKYKNYIIGAHPSDYPEDTDENEEDYLFRDNGFRFISMNEDSFGAFLTYKIETEAPDETDVSFSFNALFPKFNSLKKLKLTISDGRWGYLNDSEKGKNGILRVLDYGEQNIDEFLRDIYKKICANYIFNLEMNSYGVLKFNVCIETPTINGTRRKTTVALKYFPESGEMEVLTVT